MTLKMNFRDRRSLGLFVSLSNAAKLKKKISFLSLYYIFGHFNWLLRDRWLNPSSWST